MRRHLVAILAVLVAAPAAAATPPQLTPAVLRTVARLKASHGMPLYYLGLRYRGMTLVRAEKIGPSTDFDYADCTADELSVSALACRHVLYVEEWPPTPGEISTQGRCTFATTVRGVTAALFPVNPTTLRVFARGTTIWITGSTRASELAAARAFRGLNVALAPGVPFPARDVDRLLGRCRAPRPQRPPTAKQAYEQRMQRAFTIESASPLNVAGLQAQLIRELRAYASDVDVALRLVRGGAWRDTQRWDATSRRLEDRSRHDAGAILATVRAFAKRGYVVSTKPR